MEEFGKNLTTFLENNKLNDLLNTTELIDQINCNYNEHISENSENTYQKILLNKSDKFDIYLFIWYRLFYRNTRSCRERLFHETFRRKTSKQSMILFFIKNSLLI